MIFERGDIVVAPFRFSDIDFYKARPVLIVSHSEIYDNTGHIIAAMITGARNSTWPLDIAIDDWEAAGLRRGSTIRFKLMSIDQVTIRAKVGRIDDATLPIVGATLARLLT